uniref:Uncharacterized protein n=1 Tax=Kalanchoe fedtschenkoi TaxID=63787 RepID=A0A7N0U9Z0_KALFE
MARLMRLNSPWRLTDPFGYVSSGSEHGALLQHHDVEDESPSLSDLVECFLEDESNCCSRSDEEREAATDCSSCDRVEPCLNLNSKRVIDELLGDGCSAAAASDPYKRVLESHVSEAVKALARFGPRDKQTTSRNVMYFLRKLGHNAAICKSRWDSTSGGSLVAGHYEFIDVELNTTKSPPSPSPFPSPSGPQPRYFIDLNFAAEFEIARPTEHYANLVASLPAVVVATEETLKRVIKAVAEEAKRSLKSRDLVLPPWRKNRYMQMKWLGPYKRTTHLFRTSSPSPAVNSAVTGTRFVGFELGHGADGSNGRYTVRTR